VLRSQRPSAAMPICRRRRRPDLVVAIVTMLDREVCGRLSHRRWL